MEATPRIELGMEVLQTSALPLGYVAARSVILPAARSLTGRSAELQIRPLYIQGAVSLLTKKDSAKEPADGCVADQDAAAR